jgi:hypothetical protein
MFKPLAYAILACLVAASQTDVRRAPAAPEVQLTMGGPQLIRANQDLEFRAFLINRSAEPIVVPSPTGWYQAVLTWKITDTSGKMLQPNKHWRVIADNVGAGQGPAFKDADFVLLKPGEKTQIVNLGDPADRFVFEGKGFYEVTLHYSFSPPLDTPQTVVGQGPDAEHSQFGLYHSTLSLEIRSHLLKSPIEATSNKWKMYLESQ